MLTESEFRGIEEDDARVFIFQALESMGKKDEGREIIKREVKHERQKEMNENGQTDGHTEL
jgi:hypothetical protein